MRRILVCLLLLLVVPAAAAAAARDFDKPATQDTGRQFDPVNPQRADTPTDPDYDAAEPDDPDGRSSASLFDERYDLFGFPSALTRATATYQEGPYAGKPQVSGLNVGGAWKASRGRDDVEVAVLDTGIRWENAGLRRQIALNERELPLPRGASSYDADGDGIVTVDDWKSDPRVKASSPDGPTGQDLIRAFSDGTDDDSNGFVDDIAGWDFFDDDNDPEDASSYFAARNHGTGRAEEVAEQGNDGKGSIGICPKCRVMPVRIWDTFVSDGNTFGLGIFYAAANGAEVVEGANGSLYHSAFTEAASAYAYRKGLVQTYSGDDLNTGNHNYPANYSHAMLIQGVVPDVVGLGNSNSELGGGIGLPIGGNAPVRTYFRSANTAQFGGKSSVSMVGATGSQNAGRAAGAAALLIAAARDRGVKLSPDQTRILLEQTAEDVLPGNTGGTGTPDPAQPGWDEHFGWGRVDLGAAIAPIVAKKPPPVAAIYTPDWYAPLTQRRLDVRGLVAPAGDGGNYKWKLEWGTGLAPTQWRTAASGTGRARRTALGSIDLDEVRAALAARGRTPQDPAGPVFAPGAPTPFDQQFAVRLTVKQDGVEVPGVDRRVFTAFTDKTLRRGRPKRMGTGGEAPLRYADLNGDRRDELVLPLEDGTVHAYTRSGRELPGWPVRTRTQRAAVKHAGALRAAKLAPPREPLRGPVIADLDPDGIPEVIATAGERVYVWSARGRLRRGFPQRVKDSLCARVQDQPLKHRKCGFIGSPALARLDGPRKPPTIVAAALDGYVYAWNRRGRLRRGWPVELVDPARPEDKQMLAESIASPAVGDLNGDGRDDIVASSNETYEAERSSSGATGGPGQAVSDILGNSAGGSSRVYAIDGAAAKFLPGWPIRLNGAIQDTLPLVGPGHDAAIATVDGKPQVWVSTTGGALSSYSAQGELLRSAQQATPGPGSDQTDIGPAVLNLFESAALGDVRGDGTLAVVKYAVTLGQVVNLALVGQNQPYNHLIGANDVSTGAPLPSYPRVTDDYQFLSSSTIAEVTPGESNQVLAGTGLGLLHAYDGRTGKDVPGFPKVTGGWLFSPAALASDGRLADITREGFLFEWVTRAPACQTEWPAFRHDRLGSGNYSTDGTPPAAPGRLRVGRNRTTFIAPGDDGTCGRPATRFVARVNGRPSRRVTRALPSPGAAGRKHIVKLRLPRNARRVALYAVDDAGYAGPAAVARVR